MCTDLRNFWCETLQVNSNHNDLFARLRVTYIPYLVM